MSWFKGNISVLAAENRFQAMGRHFRPGGNRLDLSDAIGAILVLAAIVLLVWLLQCYISRSQREGYNSPRSLFRELCKAHRLNWKSRRLLHQLARGHQLAHPAQLFLEPERFETKLLPAMLVPVAAQLETVRDQIFGRRLESLGETTA